MGERTFRAISKINQLVSKHKGYWRPVDTTRDKEDLERNYKNFIMFFISHRGNIDGKITQFENSIDYILTASENYDVEIDMVL